MTVDEIRDAAMAAARGILQESLGVGDDPERLAYLFLELDRAARDGRFPRAWMPFKDGGR